MELTEQQIGKLSEYDYVALIDCSGSMGENDMPGGASRYEYMQETATAFLRDVSKFDSDGIDLVFFGGSVTSQTGVTMDTVKQAFATRRPSGGTPLAEALIEGLKLAGKSDKKDFLIVFTDGAPDDKAAAAEVIRKQSNKQSADDELTILFVQVGRDPKATAYLKKLDDDLTGCKFDIVDAKTMDEVEKFGSTGELILAAIDD